MNFPDLFGTATGGSTPFAWQSTLALSPELPQLVRVPTGAGKTEGAVLGGITTPVAFAAKACPRGVVLTYQFEAGSLHGFTAVAPLKP